MQHAFTLLGLASCIILVGLYLAFSNEAEAPEIINDNETIMLKLSSPAFEDGGFIPSKYTCDADNISPELRIEGVPEGTESLVLVMDDPDIPDFVKEERGVDKIDHWTLYNIPADTTVIPEGGSVGTVGLNSRSEETYRGPCPPDREHRYFFRLYALSGTLNFPKTPTQGEVEAAAKGMMVEQATLMGRYDRVRQ